MNEKNEQHWCEAIYDAKAAELILYGRALGLSHGESAQYIVEALLSDTLAYSEGAEQADDLTILALRWHGPAATAPQTMEAKAARM